MRTNCGAPAGGVMVAVIRAAWRACKDHDFQWHERLATRLSSSKSRNPWETRAKRPCHWGHETARYPREGISTGAAIHAIIVRRTIAFVRGNGRNRTPLRPIISVMLNSKSWIQLLAGHVCVPLHAIRMTMESTRNNAKTPSAPRKQMHLHSWRSWRLGVLAQSSLAAGDCVGCPGDRNLCGHHSRHVHHR